MKNCVKKALSNQGENYILPFLWQHGESEEVLRKYMGVIQDMGIHAICVESRPHPDFAGPKWWEDLDVMIDVAKQRNMKIWILDDYKFPTGYANGAVKNADDTLKKWALYYERLDVVGPVLQTRIAVDCILKKKVQSFFEGNDSDNVDRTKHLVGVLAYKRASETSIDLEGEAIDLTDKIYNGYLYWDVPEGYYRIFIIFQSMNSGVVNNNYVNFLKKDSVKLLIDAVYEKHYDKYASEFGKTIEGFFSDEPGFYNTTQNPYDFECIVGKKDMPLPWSDEMMEKLQNVLGKNPLLELVSLWFDTSGDDNIIRYSYMNIVTKLYQENFVGQIGDWCRKHKVQYIGHILEDDNSHCRLGPSAGHYFRAMKGQDMSGIDVVIQQVMPGRLNLHSTATNGATKGDGEFYHYGLAKLGSSAAHMDANTKGRAMCESFGAYGWSEGVQMMKWLTDFMLVRGINYFVPHAFSPKEFPDLDSPPHFYAQGNNLQYLDMNQVFCYMNRMAHLLNNGVSCVNVGILYHGEAEWSGESMLFQKPGRLCMENQIDYDLIPLENLGDGNVKDGIWQIGMDELHVIVVPYAQRLPKAAIESLVEKAEAGIKVIFINALPEGDSEGTDVSKTIQRLKRLSFLVKLESLVADLKILECGQIVLPQEAKGLRVYQYRQDDLDIMMVFNESISQTIHGKAKVLHMTPAYEYDVMNQVIYAVECQNGQLSLNLEPGEAKIYVSDMDVSDMVVTSKKPVSTRCMILDKPYKVSLATAKEYPVYKITFTLNQLEDLSKRHEGDHFHGAIRYETTFNWNKEKLGELVFTQASESLQVWVNGEKAGKRVGPPYRYDISEFLMEGTNILEFETITTLFAQLEDNLSTCYLIPPMGIVGNVKIEY